MQYFGSTARLAARRLAGSDPATFNPIHDAHGVKNIGFICFIHLTAMRYARNLDGVFQGTRFDVGIVISHAEPRAVWKIKFSKAFDGRKFQV